jgi:hypothetical protein
MHRQVRSAGIVALALGAILAACSPAAKTPSTETAETADTGPIAAAPQTGGAPTVCSTGRTKAVTNICDDGNPALFRAVNDKHALLSPKCAWYTEQLMLSDAEYLVFRNQDCSAEGWDGAAYAFADGKVKMGAASTPYAIDKVILEILPLGQGQRAQQVAINTLSTAPETERKRCIIRPVEDAPMGGVTYQITPDDAYMTELDGGGQAWTACGDYGVGVGFHFFEERQGRLLFHRLDEGDGYWDPASFTFYRKNAQGVFSKSGE